MAVTALLYSRYSETGRERDTETNELQAERCRAWCFAQAIPVGAEYADPAVSGATLDRPGIKALLADAYARPKGSVSIVIYKLDRLTRSVRDCLDLADEFNKRGIDLVSISESIDTRTATGRMLLTMLAGFAQWFREMVSERTSEAMQRYQANGRLMSRRPPYGFRAEPDPDPLHLTSRGAPRMVLVEDEEEQERIALILAEHREGSSVGDIRKRFVRGGSHCRGNPWSYKLIQDIIKRNEGKETK